jgi:hypothetical protein
VLGLGVILRWSPGVPHNGTMDDEPLLTTSAVSAMLGLGVDRVRKLDVELMPVRATGSGHRRYSLARVRAVLAKRAAG